MSPRPDGPLPARGGGERLYAAAPTVIAVLPFPALGLVARLQWGRIGVNHPIVQGSWQEPS